MNKKTIIGVSLIAVFLVVGFLTFSESKIEYTNFDQASESHRTCQVKGYWEKNKEAKVEIKEDEAKIEKATSEEDMTSFGKMVNLILDQCRDLQDSINTIKLLSAKTIILNSYKRE